MNEHQEPTELETILLRRLREQEAELLQWRGIAEARQYVSREALEQIWDAVINHFVHPEDVLRAALGTTADRRLADMLARLTKPQPPEEP